MTQDEHIKTFKLQLLFLCTTEISHAIMSDQPESFKIAL